MKEGSDTSDPQSVGDILDRLRQLGAASGEDKARLGEALEAMGHRAYGPFFIILPLIEISPIGGIPVLPTTVALIMALLAAQLILGRDHPWMPGFLINRGVKGQKLVMLAEKMQPFGERIDAWFHDRLSAFAKGPMIRVAGVAIILLCLTVPPLELVPFASTAPMLAILAFGIALLVRDGLLMLAACTIAVASCAILVSISSA